MEPVQFSVSSPQPASPPSGDSRRTMSDEKGGFNLKKYLFLSLLGFVVIFVGGFLWSWITSPMVVTVTETGEVSVPAEAATITFTLSASAADAGGAINSVKARAQSLREILKGQGISEEDIAESQIRVVPASALVQGASGFQATISMGAKTVHVSDVGNLIAILYANGAGLVSQPVISVEEKEQLEQKAFDEAMKEAKAEAARIARKNFKLIKKIVSVTQVSSPTTSTVTSKADVITEGENPQAALSGVFKIRKTVSISYKMW